MSNTSVLTDSVQHAAEQRYNDSAARRLNQRAAGPKAGAPGFENTVPELKQVAAATAAAQTEVIKKAVKDFTTIDRHFCG